MMNAAYFQRMIDYTYWANRKLWGCVAELSDEQFKKPFDYSIGSVHQQVVHMMDTEWLWLRRVRGEQPEGVLSLEGYPTQEKIRARWDEIEAFDWGRNAVLPSMARFLRIRPAGKVFPFGIVLVTREAGAFLAQLEPLARTHGVDWRVPAPGQR